MLPGCSRQVSPPEAGRLNSGLEEKQMNAAMKKLPAHELILKKIEDYQSGVHRRALEPKKPQSDIAAMMNYARAKEREGLFNILVSMTLPSEEVPNILRRLQSLREAGLFDDDLGMRTKLNSIISELSGAPDTET